MDDPQPSPKFDLFQPLKGVGGGLNMGAVQRLNGGGFW